jgi:hypothetical protein
MDIIIPKYKSSVKTMYDKEEKVPNPDTLYEIASIIFLLKSHPNDCIVIPGIKTFDDFKDLYALYIKKLFLTIYVKQCKIDVPDGWRESLLHCIKSSKRFIMIPLTIDYESDSLHANFLIYDKRKNAIERFEPNGYIIGEESYKCLGENDDIIKTFFNTYFKNLKYFSPYNFCPLNSFQVQEYITRSKLNNYLDKLGSCVTWSMWYTHLRLSNPDIPRHELINAAIYAFEKNNIDYTYFIIGFSRLIESIKNIITSKTTMDYKIIKIDNILRDSIEKEYLKIKFKNSYDIKNSIPSERRAIQYRSTPLPKPKIKSKKSFYEYKPKESTKKTKKINLDIKDIDLIPSRYLNPKYKI